MQPTKPTTDDRQALGDWVHITKPMGLALIRVGLRLIRANEERPTPPGGCESITRPGNTKSGVDIHTGRDLGNLKLPWQAQQEDTPNEPQNHYWQK